MDKKCKTQYTLEGTQPYVLTSQWPRAFTPNQTVWKPDNSLKNVTGYNNVEKYYSIGYDPRICNNNRHITTNNNEFKII